MSPVSTFSGAAWWTVNALFALSLGVVSWNVNREFQRNDDQEKRIQGVERALVKMDYMAETLNKIERKVDKLSGVP